MKKNKSENKSNLIFTRETLGMTVLLFCLIVLLALLSGSKIFSGFGAAICTFMYGTFGYGSFFVVALLACLGVWLTFERRIKIKFLPALFISLTAYMLFLLFHAVSTNGSNWQTDSYPISNYINQCYQIASEGFPDYTFGGVLSAILVYPIARVTTYIGAYIIFSIFAILCGYFTYVFFKKCYGKGSDGDASVKKVEGRVTQPVYDGSDYVRSETEAQPAEQYMQKGYGNAQPVQQYMQKGYANTQPVQQYMQESYGHTQPVQQYAGAPYNSVQSELRSQPLSYSKTEPETERDEDRFDPARLGRQILFGNDFAAESYRRNGIFDENSYFNHPIRNDSDYIRSFSDGKNRRPTDYGMTYSSAFEKSVDNQPPTNHGGILYGDAPTDKLGDGHASSYTAPGNVHNYQDDEPAEDFNYSNSVYDSTENDAYQTPEEVSEVKTFDGATDFAASNPYDITHAAAPLPDEGSPFDRGEQIFGTVQQSADLGESGIRRNIFAVDSQLSHGGTERLDRREIFCGEREIKSDEVGMQNHVDIFGQTTSREFSTDRDSLYYDTFNKDGAVSSDNSGGANTMREAPYGNGSESLSPLFSSTDQRISENNIESDISHLSRMESRADIFDESFGTVDGISPSPVREEAETSNILREARDFIAEVPSIEHESVTELTSRSSPAVEMPSRPVAAYVAENSQPAQAAPKPHVWKKYVRPSMELLDDYPDRNSVDSAEIEDNKRVIVETLQSFKIDCEISDVIVAPALTRYDVTIFDRTNIKNTLLKYKDPIAMALKRDNVNAYLNFTKGALSIEVPNARRAIVGLKSMMLSASFIKAKTNTLTFSLGKNLDGACICPDIRKMPHLLVAGTSGSGKSICLSSLLISLLYKYGPEDLRLILVDPKQVEFISYDKLPHLMINEIIFDVDKAIKALNWAIKEMERRYTLFKDMTETGARAKDGLKTATKEIDEYNAHIEQGEERLPKILIVLDEFGDLMLSAKKDIEGRIIKLVQKGRAAGIHLILATQRPSVDCITGLIKSNLDARIGFKVGSFDDSRTIFDVGGAEKLLGKGDMYFRSKEYAEGKMQRIQGCFVDTPEVQRVTDFIKANNETYFDQSISDFINTVEEPEGSSSLSEGGDSYEDNKIDDTFLRALKYCVASNAASVSMIQRRFPIGYIKACKIVDWMEKMNYITGSEGSKSRKVLMSMEEFVNKYGEIDD